MHPATLLSFNQEMEKIAKETRKKYEPDSHPGHSAAVGAGLGAAAGAVGAVGHGAGQGAAKATDKIRNLRSIKRQGGLPDGDFHIPRFEFKIGTKEQVHAFKNRNAAMSRTGAKARREKVLNRILAKGTGEGAKAGLKRAPLAALGLGAAGAAAGYGLHKLVHKKSEK